MSHCRSSPNLFGNIPIRHIAKYDLQWQPSLSHGHPLNHWNRCWCHPQSHGRAGAMGQRVAAAHRLERRHQERAPREAAGRSSRCCKGNQQPKKIADADELKLARKYQRKMRFEVGATKLGTIPYKSWDQGIGWLDGEDSHVDSQAPSGNWRRICGSTNWRWITWKRTRLYRQENLVLGWYNRLVCGASKGSHEQCQTSLWW